MFDSTKPTVLLLGRYQPWHPGHTELFKRAITKTGQVLIQVRTCVRDKQNPYSYFEVRLRIIDALRKEGFIYGVEYTCLKVPNITNISYGGEGGYMIEQDPPG